MSYWESKTIEQRISDLEREVQSLRHIVENGLSIIDNRLFSQDTSESQSRQQNEENQTKKPVMETNIDDLGLSVRAYNCLCRAGIRNISMLLDFLASDEAEHEIDFLKLGKIRNCGKKTYNEIANALMKIGVIREIKKDIHGSARYASVNYKYD